VLRRASRVCLFALLFLLVLSPSLLAQETPGGWSPPRVISLPNENAWFADVFTDPYGYTHIGWSTADEAFDMIDYTGSSTTSAWTEPTIIVASTQNPPGNSYVARPYFTADHQGFLYMGYQNQVVYLTSAMVENAWNPKGWEAPDPIAGGYFSIPVFDGVDGLHVITTDNVIDITCLCLDLNYRHVKTAEMEWPEPTKISRSTRFGASKPQVLVETATGALFVVWEQGIDGDRGYVQNPASVMFSRSLDNGATWSDPYQIAPAATAAPAANEGVEVIREPLARNITIARDREGALITVWWSMPENQILYRRSLDNGATWGEPNQVPGGWGVGTVTTSRQDAYHIAADSNGDLHLVYVGLLSPEDRDLKLFHSVWNGVGWTPPEILAAYQGDLPEWPRISIGLGNVADVVWHVRPQYLSASADAVTPTYEVWHMRKILDTPAFAPLPLPERPAAVDPVAVTVSLSEMLAGVTQTLPISELTSEQRDMTTGLLQSQSIRSENDDVLLLAVAVLPVLALLLLVVFVVRKMA